MTQPVLTLTRDDSAPYYTLQSDGWYRCMEQGRPSFGYGLMLRQIAITGRTDRELMMRESNTERRRWSLKIGFCPSADDTGLGFDTSLGYFYGTRDEMVDFIELVRRENSLPIEWGRSKWMP